MNNETYSREALQAITSTYSEFRAQGLGLSEAITETAKKLELPRGIVAKVLS